MRNRSLHRRNFLKGSTRLAGGFMASSPFLVLAQNESFKSDRDQGSGYGHLSGYQQPGTDIMPGRKPK
jgi:hypothetical protein